MIQLNASEMKLASVILEYAGSRTPPTTVRFAGGWVRDKIMGLSSHDIDVVVDNTSGYLFALGLSEQIHKTRPGEASAEGKNTSPHPTVHKIQANPSKSKHLETAVLSIFGISVDFAHLRCETYADTRIPTIRRGTPKEDAFRRDLTANSLFYNLSSGEVEDLTGNGLEDIKNGIIRTPLDPKITLEEDPLRIMRIFRFRTKMGFTIDPQIYEALQLPAIKLALQNKVAKERINTELFKMLDSEVGWMGMVEIIKTGYAPIIFTPDCDKVLDEVLSMSFFERCKEYAIELQSRHDSLVKDSDSPPIDVQNVVWRSTNKQLIWLYMALHNYIGIKSGTSKRIDYVNVKIMQDSLKGCREWIRTINEIERGIEYVLSAKNDSSARITLKCEKHIFEVLMICSAAGILDNAVDIGLDIILKGIYDCYSTPPLVSGNDLKGLKIQPREYHDFLFNCHVYQIENPKASKEEIIERCKECFNVE